MRSFEGKNADQVWRALVLDLVDTPDLKVKSRCGNTLEFLQCSLVISNPQERWILSRIPPYNPAFGLVEFIWIFNGDNSSEVPNFWNPQLSKYTGSSKTFHGAYGYRLKKNFCVDQIKRAYSALKSNPESRQVALQIWDPYKDLPDEHGNPSSEDIPCNISSLLTIRGGRLYWTQIMRSNDVVRGLPYNIIQFTLLQEFFASWLGCEMGDYVHISNSMHIYTDCINDSGLIAESEYAQSIGQKSLIDITFEQTSHCLSVIYEDLISTARLQEESDKEKIKHQLHDIFSPTSRVNICRPVLVRDMLCVIGSDAARRLGNMEFASDILKYCEDENLRYAAENWLIRNKHDGDKECQK